MHCHWCIRSKQCGPKKYTYLKSRKNPVKNKKIIIRQLNVLYHSKLVRFMQKKQVSCETEVKLCCGLWHGYHPVQLEEYASHFIATAVAIRLSFFFFVNSYIKKSMGLQCKLSLSGKCKLQQVMTNSSNTSEKLC